MIGVSPDKLDGKAEAPIYRQLFEQIRTAIQTGVIRKGERLPPTRELAIELGLNRTTVSAAYSLLESEGFITGHVGRGSFVCFEIPEQPVQSPANTGLISFASSRPAEDQFPVAEFQDTCREVIHGPAAAGILQLGSPTGYAPLRHYLLEAARREGNAGPDDDILITNGCQQALDLIQRTLIAPGDTVVVEDPVYHGLKNVFQRGGTRLVGVPVGADGIDAAEVEQAILRERPKLLLVTSSFQNPTGATLPLRSRVAIAKLAREHKLILVDNNIYGDLRYEGEALPTLRQFDPAGNSLLLGSFSKIAFPGLRVGWIIGPRWLIARLAETKQWCDLHTDQLSQAILLRFAESGRLEAHRKRVRAAGAIRLRAVLAACERYLPAGTRFTRPQGGMSLWVQLPEPLDTAELLPRAQRENVTYLPGRHFTVSSHQPGALRLSFGGLSTAQIEAGVERLGRVFREELQRVRSVDVFETAPAMV